MRQQGVVTVKFSFTQHLDLLHTMENHNLNSQIFDMYLDSVWDPALDRVTPMLAKLEGGRGSKRSDHTLRVVCV